MIAAFTHNSFDDQERNLTFVKTDFEVLKLKFHACSFNQTFYSLQNCILRELDKRKILLYKLSIRTCMYDRGIKQ